MRHFSPCLLTGISIYDGQMPSESVGIMSTQLGRVDRYELQELLGQAGTTEVWKAFDTQARRYVALKLLHVQFHADPDFVTRFQHVSQVVSSLHHPNILRYYDFTLSQPLPSGVAIASIAMDYVHGGSLADYIRNTSQSGSFLPIADITRLFLTIATTLEYMHHQGVVHGQLKPTNILLNRSNTTHSTIGEPILADYGAFKLLKSPGDNASGWQINTALYTAPEQILGAPGDARSDIYSLGIMLYELCTGTPPYSGNNAATLITQHINASPVSPDLIHPGLSATLSTIIMRCLAKDPSSRFPDAASLAQALSHVLTQTVEQEGKEASFISVHQESPDYSTKAIDAPTVLSTGQHFSSIHATPAALTPSSPGITGASFSPSSPGAITPESGKQQPQGVMYSSMTPSNATNVINSSRPVVSAGGPVTPMPPLFSLEQSKQNVPTHPSSPSSPPTRPSSRKRARRWIWIVLSGLLLLVLIGSGLEAYLTFFSGRTSSTTTTTAPAGHAYFVSSGLLSANEGANQGITDQLQITLTTISPPPPGKSYYVWLLNDRKLEWNPLLLGQLTMNNGVAVLSYPGDAAHTDLLATYSRFFVTEEDATTPPVNPSQNASALRFYAEFSQTPNPADPEHFSVYDHIRHLLADDPKVKTAGLTGGLDIWLYRNTQKILEWAGSARDAQRTGSTVFIRRQLTRILDYLDGTYYIQKDLPGQQLLVNPTIAKIGLLTFDAANQNPPGYIYHVGKHLREITSLPQSTQEQKILGQQINQALDVVNIWLHKIRDDALRLYAMNDTQLLGNDGRTTLDEMTALANDTFVGQISPQGPVLDGIVQIHYDIQRLATFSIQACTTSRPCPALV